jgi:hypothetical protein
MLRFEGRPSLAPSNRDAVKASRPWSVGLAALVLSACAPAAVEESTTVAPTTTTTIAPTTTAAPTTTTTLATTTTTEGPQAFETIPGTAPDVLTSYETTALIVFDFGEMSFDTMVEGVFTQSAYRCDMTLTMTGLTLVQTVVGTPDTVWIDAGTGFQEYETTSVEAEDIGALCPASPGFWTDFSTIPAAEGEAEEKNGIPSQRLDATALMSTFGGLGVEDVEGVGFERAIVWVADPGGWVSAIDMVMVLDAAAGAEMMGLPVDEAGGTSRIEFDIQILNPDDPGLTVEPPDVG